MDQVDQIFQEAKEGARRFNAVGVHAVLFVFDDDHNNTSISCVRCCECPTCTQSLFMLLDGLKTTMKGN